MEAKAEARLIVVITIIARGSKSRCAAVHALATGHPFPTGKCMSF